MSAKNQNQIALLPARELRALADLSETVPPNYLLFRMDVVVNLLTEFAVLTNEEVVLDIFLILDQIILDLDVAQLYSGNTATVCRPSYSM